MTRFSGLLYSIILPEGKRLSMAPFRDLMNDLGYGDVRTLLATGNVLFEADGPGAREIEEVVEARFTERFGKHIDFIVREADDWKRLAAGNPFPAESREDGARVGVRVMREPLTGADEARLRAALTEHETMHVVDGDPWFHFCNGVAGPRVASLMSARRIAVGTSRNWNTIRRIDTALHGETG